MKRLIKGLLAMTTLLVGSCSSKLLVKKVMICSSYTIKQDDPRYVTCELKEELGSDITTWEGIIDYFIPDNHLKDYYAYWYEYVNNTHALRYGTLR